jgi:ATP-dependent DNA helicase RecG
MRVYKDLGMVEQLGSGVPRILQAYNKDCFKFSENFLRMIFPAPEKLSLQVNMQVEELIEYGMVKNKKHQTVTCGHKT